jgi:hypothetical protein
MLDSFMPQADIEFRENPVEPYDVRHTLPLTNEMEHVRNGHTVLQYSTKQLRNDELRHGGSEPKAIDT